MRRIFEVRRIFLAFEVRCISSSACGLGLFTDLCGAALFYRGNLFGGPVYSEILGSRENMSVTVEAQSKDSHRRQTAGNLDP